MRNDIICIVTAKASQQVYYSLIANVILTGAIKGIINLQSKWYEKRRDKMLIWLEFYISKMGVYIDYTIITFNAPHYSFQ